MRILPSLTLAGLAAVFVARPAIAAAGGTNGLAAAESSSDSANATPTVLLAAAGGALGLASVFALIGNGPTNLGNGLPTSPPGVTVPPEAPFAPPTVTPVGTPPSNDPPSDGDPGDFMPTTTTPEPVTMALLASGLAGMGGASLLRRKKRV